MLLTSPTDVWLERVRPEESGLHRTLFTYAAFLLGIEMCTKGEAFVIMRKTCGDIEDRFVPDREIYGAIDYAHRRITGEATPGVQWPSVSMPWRAEIVSHRVDMAKLKANMPVPLPTLRFLQMLFQPTDLLCIGKTSYDFRTIRLESIPEANKDLHICEFITPSPMSSVAGITASGDWSEHARSNTGSRVYAVIEFDSGEPHEHAAILKYLARSLPLVMIVYSGGKSFHGWFKSSHANEQHMEVFYREAVMLGADPKMFSPTQFSRLPMGRNNRTQRTQRVIYFNPRYTYFNV